jgi:hypothetical protein
MQMLGGLAGGTRLSDVPLGLAQLDDGLGERGEPGDQCHQGQRAVVADGSSRG